MNKLIASAALIAASTALASATTVTVDIIGILDSDTSGWLNTDNYSSNTSYGSTLGAYNSSSVSADDVVFAFGPTTGVYADYTSNSFIIGAGNLNNQTTGGPYTDLGSTTLANVTSGSGFTLTARGGYSGTWAAVVISVETLLAQSETATIDDLTTINISYTTSNAGYPVLTAWVVSTDDGDTDTATELTVTTSGTTSVSGTIDVSSVTEDDVIVVLLSSAGQAATVTGLSLTTTIPEPSAFALLAGVGALAFAVSRRRRSRRA